VREKKPQGVPFTNCSVSLVVALGSLGTMASPQHLAKIKQGVEVWNKWREEYPDLRPDLSGAHLSETILKDVVLWRANLARVDLVASNLAMANLGEANLERAFLADANLSWAILCGANLQRATLWGANLKRADLMRADLRNAFLGEVNLRKANLLAAKFEGADFREANLKKAENLNLTQLSKAKTLYKAQLDPELMEKISAEYPHLLRSPKENK
jgi:hypothetical protein